MHLCSLPDSLSILYCTQCSLDLLFGGNCEIFVHISATFRILFNGGGGGGNEGEKPVQHSLIYNGH